MPTNVSIDPKLIEQVLEVSGESTIEAAVARALQEFRRAPAAEAHG